MHRLQELVRLHRLGLTERRAAKELRIARNTAKEYRRALSDAGVAGPRRQSAVRGVLFRLLSDEVERRDGKQLGQRVRRANFEHDKTLEDFDFHFNPNVPKARVIDLATCDFVEKRQSVLLLGPAGVGKSHIAQALGHCACRLGKSVLRVVAQDLFKQLRAARADGSHDRRMLRFTTPDLLIIDDLGLRPLRDDEAVDLYEIIRTRYERHSTMITSNRTTSEMGELIHLPDLRWIREGDR